MKNVIPSTSEFSWESSNVASSSDYTVWNPLTDLPFDFKAIILDFLGFLSPNSSISWLSRELIRVSNPSLFNSFASWITMILGLYLESKLLRIFLTWPVVVYLLFRTCRRETIVWNLDTWLQYRHHPSLWTTHIVGL